METTITLNFCPSTDYVHTYLVEWQKFVTEYESHTGHKFSEHGHIDALKQFLPENMSQQVDTQVTWNR